MSTVVKPLHYWICGKCDEQHDYEDDARECCAPEVYEIYVCPVCDKEHDYWGDAFRCCGDMEGVPFEDTKQFPAHGDTMSPAEYVVQFDALNGLKHTGE